MLAATSIIAEYAAGLGIEAGKNYFKEKVDEKKLQEALTSYIESQRKYNEICLLVEEFDFQGLVEYINENLLDEVERRFFCLKPKDRGVAHGTIVSAAVDFSEADTPEAKANVAKVISTCLDIIHEFYRQKIDLKYYLLAAELADAIIEPVSEQINDSTERILQKIESINVSEYSLEHFVNDAQSGDFKSINSKLGTIFDNIGCFHNLYPDYGFGYGIDGLKSVPLTPDALKKYPPKIKFTGRVRAGDKYIDDPDIDLFDYAYRHQLVLTMDVTEAKKYLGDIEDPAGFNVPLVTELRAYPPKIPPAFPVIIKVNKNVFFDNIMLRTKEIEDDGTYIIDNHEQTDVPYRFGFRVNFSEGFKVINDSNGKPALLAKNIGFNVRIRDASNDEHLQFLKFMKALSRESDLSISIKDAGELMVARNIIDVRYSTGFVNVDEEIDFLERICDIEKYFNVRFTIDEEIDNEIYSAIMQISELVRNDEVSHTWTETSFSATVDETSRTKIMEMGREVFMISYVGTMAVNFFGVQIEYRYMRTFKSAVIKDYDRIRQLANLLNDGDPIRIIMEPGEDDIAIDTLNIPERLQL